MIGTLLRGHAHQTHPAVRVRLACSRLLPESRVSALVDCYVPGLQLLQQIHIYLVLRQHSALGEGGRYLLGVVVGTVKLVALGGDVVDSWVCSSQAVQLEMLIRSL